MAYLTSVCCFIGFPPYENMQRYSNSSNQCVLFEGTIKHNFRSFWKPWQLYSITLFTVFSRVWYKVNLLTCHWQGLSFTCSGVSSLAYWQVMHYYQSDILCHLDGLIRLLFSAVFHGCWWCRKIDDNPLWEFQIAGEAGRLHSDCSSGLMLAGTTKKRKRRTGGGHSKGYSPQWHSVTAKSVIGCVRLLAPDSC